MSSKNKPKNGNILDEAIYKKEQEQRKILAAKKKISKLQENIQSQQGEIDKMKNTSNKVLKAMYFCDDPVIKKRIDKFMSEIEEYEKAENAEKEIEMTEIQTEIPEKEISVEENSEFDFNSYLKNENGNSEE